MSSANIFDQDHHEESFWPSFTDIMMVIVMIFLLVVVAVMLANTRLMEQLRNSILAQEQASELAEFTLQENATLEEQLAYYRRLASATELELLESRAATEQARTEVAQLRTALEQIRTQSASQSASIAQRDEQISDLQRDLSSSSSEVSTLRAELSTVRAELSSNTSVVDTLRDALSTARTELSSARTELSATRTELSTARTELNAAREELASSRAEATESETALQDLLQQTAVDREALANLKGEYEELDKKYQLLVRPSRSAKDKTVVEVVYQRSGYRIRAPGEANYRNVSRTALEAELGRFKERLGSALYVKIVIPENSGLSYNDAWIFTRDMLNKYDYYYQTDSGTDNRGDAVELGDED